MKECCSKVLLAAVGASMVLAIGGQAKAQDAVRQLQDCRVIQNMASRLFCYDRIVDGLTAGAIVTPAPAAPAPVPPAPVFTPTPRAAAPAAPTAPPAIAPSTPPRPASPPPVARTAPPAVTPAQPVARPSTAPAPSPPPQFGDDSLPAEKRRTAPAVSDEQMSATIATISKDRYGNSVIALDNGQTWRQTEGATFTARAGTAVVLSKGMLGAYFMKVADGNRTIRVKRIQ